MAAGPPRALPSVIVDTEKVLREADGPVEMSALTLPSGGEVFAPGCASENWTVRAGEEPEEHKRHFVWCRIFLSVVEIGQYFMTKDTGDLTQFHAVACREYTLPREEGSSQPRGWIQGNTKIGPVLEVTTSCLHGT